MLEVPRDAAPEAIKRAFRLKQMATHPDKNHGAVGAHEASQRVNAVRVRALMINPDESRIGGALS